MPNLTQMLDFVKDNLLSWLAFAAIPVILFCIACLMPRGKEKKLVNIERFLIAFFAIAVPATFLVIGLINDNILGFDVVKGLFTYGIVLTASVIGMALVLVWGSFTSESYITQALYGIVFGFCMPYGLVSLLFPSTWTTATNILDVVTTPFDLARLLMYAACFFIPIWLVRSGEYKLRLSSVWHLLTGISLGGCTMMFLVEAEIVKSRAIYKLLHLFDGFKVTGALSDTNKDYLINFSIVVGIFAALVLLAGAVMSIIRKIVKSETRLFVSESFGGGFTRTIGNILANGVCIASLFILPQVFDHASAMPTALIYLAPILAFFVIVVVTALIADTVEIKRAMKRALAEGDAEEAATEETTEDAATEEVAEKVAEETTEATEEVVEESAEEAVEEVAEEATETAVEEAADTTETV